MSISDIISSLSTTQATHQINSHRPYTTPVETISVYNTLGNMVLNIYNCQSDELALYIHIHRHTFSGSAGSKSPTGKWPLELLMQLPQGSHKVIDPGCSKPAVCVTERVSSSVVFSKLRTLLYRVSQCAMLLGG